MVAVDSKHQVIVHAEAFGQPQEHALLGPMLEGVRANFAAIGEQDDVFRKAKLTADSGFHTEKNMAQLFTEGIDGYVADHGFRKRDPRFAEAGKYKARHRRERDQARRAAGGVFRPQDFHYDPDQSLCLCPAGKRLYRNGSNVVIMATGR